jgi:hypothetical protein
VSETPSSLKASLSRPPAGSISALSKGSPIVSKRGFVGICTRIAFVYCPAIGYGLRSVHMT